MPNRGQKKRTKEINKRLGRDKTIKNTNKSRGKGTTKTNRRLQAYLFIA